MKKNRLFSVIFPSLSLLVKGGRCPVYLAAETKPGKSFKWISLGLISYTMQLCANYENFSKNCPTHNFGCQSNYWIDPTSASNGIIEWLVLWQILVDRSTTNSGGGTITILCNLISGVTTRPYISGPLPLRPPITNHPWTRKMTNTNPKWYLVALLFRINIRWTR